MANVQETLTGRDNFIFLLQEPCLHKGKAAGLLGANPMYPRAAILSTNNLKVWYCPECSSRDICTVLWIPGTVNMDEDNNVDWSWSPHVVSMYLNITAPVDDIFRKGWKKLMTDCTRSHSITIAYLDTNARRTLWGERVQYPR